jgi:hypothetical protein
MLRDEDFAKRFEGHTATQLRNRWRKLGTSEFNNTTTASTQERQLAAKRETVFESIAAAAPPALARPAPGASSASSSAQHIQTSPAGATAAVQAALLQVTALAPPAAPFVAYRPYPSHVFDQARKG